MTHRLLREPEKEGWERSDFPIVCETCLGPNPYVRMQRMEYGAECHISKRPYTKFRWKPGSDARYKATIICQEVAKAKNVCQVCLLDLDHNLPVQVRDQLQNAVVEDIPESEVGLEFQLALKESRGELGAQYKDAQANEDLLRLSRTTPYYKRNRARICTYFVHGRCKRGAECPYRHEMPEGGELADQNIRDRYYGVNDPVAKKMMRRLGERAELEPPADASITTLYVGNVEPNWDEGDLRAVFEKHGTVAKVRLVQSKSCAFVTFATRAEAEAAARKLQDALIIHGTRCKLLWGKPQAPAGATGVAVVGTGPGGAAAGPVDYFGMPAYPSMDPQLMGTGPGGPPLGLPPPSHVPHAGHTLMPPGPGGVPGMPPGMMPPPLSGVHMAPRMAGPPRPPFAPHPQFAGPPRPAPPSVPPAQPAEAR